LDEKQITYKVWLLDGKLEDDDEVLRVAALNSPFSEIIANPSVEAARFRDEPLVILNKLVGSPPKPRSAMRLINGRPQRLRSMRILGPF
jgi:hypothetical protein